MTYTIYHGVYAIFNNKERAEKWIENFNAKMYVDKTLLKQDFSIKEDDE